MAFCLAFVDCFWFCHHAFEWWILVLTFSLWFGLMFSQSWWWRWWHGLWSWCSETCDSNTGIAAFYAKRNVLSGKKNTCIAVNLSVEVSSVTYLCFLWFWTIALFSSSTLLKTCFFWKYGVLDLKCSSLPLLVILPAETLL